MILHNLKWFTQTFWFDRVINTAFWIKILFLAGLLYLLIPAPSSIEAFPALPESVKSSLEGDTIQNPNIAAYFSQFKRDGIVEFYKDFFSKSLILGLPLPFISLNHPPEAAYKYVRDQQESTFLEEYVHPLRESIFVNGYQPAVENDIFKKRDRSFVGDHIEYQGDYFVSKATLRYYPSAILARVLIYLSIWVVAYLLNNLIGKAWQGEV